LLTYNDHSAGDERKGFNIDARPQFILHPGKETAPKRAHCIYNFACYAKDIRVSTK
jgi:hypothetical protein